MDCLVKFSTPQLEKIHSGKVRESFRIDKNSRMIVVTDRISCFDKVLKTPIPYKGAVLNGISNFWFEKTSQIIDNHFIKCVDNNITIVKEASPIRIEMIVRGYLAGSMWRNYQNGKMTFSGIKISDGMKKNEKFIKPIVTPTTKEESDREISPAEIIKEGLTTKDVYEQMEEISLKLFQFGTDILAEKNLILVDAKYEFGLINGYLILIDEIHTPDSSRFWWADIYNKDQQNVQPIDKEYVRQWLLKNRTDGKFPDSLPNEIVKETSARYLELYKMVTGEVLLCNENEDMMKRIYNNLVKEQIIKDGYIAIIMGSISDLEHCNKIKKCIEKYDIMTDLRVVSAHKNGEQIIKMVEEYNSSIEPGSVIAVAGKSNGLGGALAANLNIPVISCPPFKDNLDILLNINSSLMMPSKVPSATVINPESSALAALRSLNLHRLRNIFSKEIMQVKESLKEDDMRIRKR